MNGWVRSPELVDDVECPECEVMHEFTVVNDDPWLLELEGECGSQTSIRMEPARWDE